MCGIFARLLLATLALAAAAPAQAQEAWPQRPVTIIVPFAAAGNVRPLAVTTPQRSAAAPDLPTIGETLKGYEATAWQGLFAPAGIAPAILDKIAAEVRHVWGLPEVVAALKNVGAEPATSSPDEFAAYIAAERVRWGEVVKASGVKID